MHEIPADYVRARYRGIEVAPVSTTAGDPGSGHATVVADRQQPHSGLFQLIAMPPCECAAAHRGKKDISEKWRMLCSAAIVPQAQQYLICDQVVNLLSSLCSLCLHSVGLLQVNAWADDLDLGAQNESVVALAEEYCGPDATTSTSCNLRTAFFYASSLIGSDVEIWVNAGQQELQMEQSASIQVSGYVCMMCKLRTRM